MNLSLLKSLKFWIACAIALLGVLLSQGVVADGSVWAGIVGWVMTLLGAAGGGHAVATNPPTEG